MEVDSQGFPLNWPMHKALGDVVIECDNISKTYKLDSREDSVHALNDVTICHGNEIFPIRKGEFVMLRGASGGGKTTFLNILGTIDEPTTGSLSLLGRNVDFSSKDSLLAKLRLNEIGFVFQSFNLLSALSAFENVELPMTLANQLSKKERTKRALSLLKTVGLQDRINHLPSELSGGEQQRVTIARALANEPSMLIMDEPTSDLDTRNTVDIMNLLLDINLTHGTTCVMVTHNDELEVYADRILYLADGRLTAQALNSEQSRLDYDRFMAYLNSHRDTKSAMGPALSDPVSSALVQPLETLALQNTEEEEEEEEEEGKESTNTSVVRPLPPYSSTSSPQSQSAPSTSPPPLYTSTTPRQTMSQESLHDLDQGNSSSSKKKAAKSKEKDGRRGSSKPPEEMEIDVIASKTEVF